ncbi:hypothetical protein J1614_005993 [Plenodomus biglobosus]|nr:hypothetical protein J1614_005993 [Plenodomus biglobosus]
MLSSCSPYAQNNENYSAYEQHVPHYQGQDTSQRCMSLAPDLAATTDAPFMLSNACKDAEGLDGRAYYCLQSDSRVKDTRTRK